MLKSAVIKHSVTIGGHKTSVSLEPEFWEGLHEIAAQRGMTLSALLAEIDVTRLTSNLSSQVRMVVLEHYRSFGLDHSDKAGRAGAPY